MRSLQLSNTEMEQSLTVCAELKNKLLIARDRRHAELNAVLAGDHSAVIMVSLNIPGAEKTPLGSDTLMDWGRRRVEDEMAAACVSECLDAAGLCLLFVSDLNPRCCKRLAVDIEERMPAARLLDIDIYTHDNGQVGRATLGMKPRSCLLCDRPAMECMRRENHGSDSIVQSAHDHLRTLVNEYLS